MSAAAELREILRDVVRWCKRQGSMFDLEGREAFEVEVDGKLYRVEWRVWQK